MGVGQNNSSTLPEAAAVTIDSSDEDKFDEFLKTVVLEEKNMNNGNWLQCVQKTLLISFRKIILIWFLVF